MSFYVKRSSKRNPAGVAFVGPIASASQAEKEAAAWISSGETAEVIEATATVRAEVRLWDRITHADDAHDIVFFHGEPMTMASYRLNFERAA